MTDAPTPAPHPYNDARHPHARHVSPARSLDWLKAGWFAFLASPGVWMVISLIFFVMLVVLGLIPLLGQAITLIGFPILVAGMVVGCDALAKGQPLRVEHLFAGLRVHSHAANLALIGVFYMLFAALAAFVSIVVIGSAALTGYLLGVLASLGLGLLTAMMFGFILFTVLWVLLITALWFAAPLVVLRDTPPLDAMKMSLSACFHNFGAFLVLGVMMYVLIWVAMLPAALGLLVLIPVLAGTLYASYQDIFGSIPVAPSAPAVIDEKAPD